MGKILSARTYASADDWNAGGTNATTAVGVELHQVGWQFGSWAWSKSTVDALTVIGATQASSLPDDPRLGLPSDQLARLAAAAAQTAAADADAGSGPVLTADAMARVLTAVGASTAMATKTAYCSD